MNGVNSHWGVSHFRDYQFRRRSFKETVIWGISHFRRQSLESTITREDSHLRRTSLEGKIIWVKKIWKTTIMLFAVKQFPHCSIERAKTYQVIMWTSSVKVKTVLGFGITVLNPMFSLRQKFSSMLTINEKIVTKTIWKDWKTKVPLVIESSLLSHLRATVEKVLFEAFPTYRDMSHCLLKWPSPQVTFSSSGLRRQNFEKAVWCRKNDLRRQSLLSQSL